MRALSLSIIYDQSILIDFIKTELSNKYVLVCQQSAQLITPVHFKVPGQSKQSEPSAVVMQYAINQSHDRIKPCPHTFSTERGNPAMVARPD